MPLIRWYKLDGDVLDSSPNRQHGTNNGGTGVTFSSSYGKIGQGGYFVGNRASYITIPEVNLTTHHTICFWTYGLDTGGDANGSMICGIMSTVDDYIYCANNYRTRIQYTNNLSDWTTDTDYYQKWRHVTIRLHYNSSDDLTAELFLDGEYIEDDTNYDGVFDIDTIGAAHTTTSLDFIGYMNDFRIYDHALSKKEIQEIAKAKVLHLKFQEKKDSSGDIILDSSDFGRNATLDANAPIWTPEPKLGGSYDYDTSGEYIELSSAEFPVTFWDEQITISLWFFYQSGVDSWDSLVHGSTTAAWSTSYWLAVLSASSARFAIGASSNNFDPGLTVDAWHHICATYDGSNVNVYVNGVEKTSSAAETTAITSVSGIKFGVTGDGNYDTDGKFADIRIYATAFTPTQVDELYQTGASLDANGNLFCRVLQEGGHVQGTSSSLLDYTEFTEGTTPPSGWAYYYTAEVDVAYGDDPWGRNTLLFKSIPTNPGTHDGSFYTDYKSIDNTKTYRFSVWCNRTTLGSDGNIYLGTNGLTENVVQLYNGASEGNPYFWYYGPNATYTPSEWFLIVGHVLPYTTSTGSTSYYHPESGQYYPTTGTFVPSPTSYIGNREDYKWGSGTTGARLRALFYGDDIGTSRVSWCYPRIDLCDGTEPTIAQLLGGNYYDPTYTGGVSNIGRTGIVASPNFSEVGPVDELAYYWPMNGDLLDYGNVGETALTNNGASLTEGGPRDRSYYTFASTDYMDIPWGNGVSPYPLTISLWCTTSVAHGDMVIGTNQTTNDRLYIGSNNGNWSFGVQAYPWNTTGDYAVDTGGAWTHLALTLTDPGGGTGSANLYVNGQLDSRTITFPAYTLENDIQLGTLATNQAYYWQGDIMDVRIYSKVLTAKEINILSKMFDTDAANRNEMSMGATEWYVNGQFKEQL